MDLKEIKKRIEAIEEKLALIEFEISNIKIWQVLRVDIYSKIISQIFPLSETSIKNKKFLIFKRGILNSIKYNPFLDFKTHENLVFESSRYLYVDNEYIDVYTKYLCDELRQNNVTFVKYQCNSLNDIKSKKDSNTKHLDFIILMSLFISKFYPIKITNNQEKKICEVAKMFEENFKLKYNFYDKFKNEIKVFKVQLMFYRILLKIQKPQKIFFVAYNGRAPLIKAAKEKLIETIELQHGYIMSKDDIIWDYPLKYVNKLEYFCDKFYQWDNNYLFTAKIPINRQNIVFYGNKFLEKQKIKYKNVSKIKHQILIASQPFLSELILDYILKNLNTLQDYNIIYKLHPTEFSTNFKYFLRNSISKFTNVHIADENESLFFLLSQSQFLISVSSSVTVEALNFNVKVLLLELPGIEMMEPLISKNLAQKINPSEKLTKFLLN